VFLKRLFSNTLIYAIGPQLPKVASLFVLPIVTKYLTVTDYGISGVVTAYTAFFSVLAELGFSVLLMNSFYNYKEHWKIRWRHLHFYLSVWAFIYGALVITLLYFVIPVEAIENRWNIIFCVVIPAVFFNVTIFFATRYYQFSGKPLYTGIISALIGGVSIFLNLYFIAYLKLAYMGWFYSVLIASFLNFLAYAYPVYFKLKLIPIVKFKSRNLKKYLKISLPLVPHSYANYLLNSSDRLVMEQLNVNTSRIGEYSFAYMFGSYMDFFGNAVGLAIGPLYTKLFSEKTKQANMAVHFITHWLQSSFILACFIVALWMREFFSILVSNPELAKYYALGIIIVMGYSYRPYYWVSISRLQYNENTSQLWKISFIAGIGNVVLNLIFIPFYGVIAAAITTFISLMYVGFSGFYLKAFKQNETETYKPVFVIIIIIASTTAVYLLKDTSILIKGSITGILTFMYLVYWFKKKVRFAQILWQ